MCGCVEIFYYFCRSKCFGFDFGWLKNLILGAVWRHPNSYLDRMSRMEGTKIPFSGLFLLCSVCLDVICEALFLFLLALDFLGGPHLNGLQVRGV